MNITELARRLRISQDELREKIPSLGFSIGKHAIKVDDRVAQQVIEAWSEMSRRARLATKMEEQKMHAVLREVKRAEAVTREVALPPVSTVRDFASRLELPIPRVMQELMRNGILASLNERIDFDTAAIVAEDLGFKAVHEGQSAKQDKDAGLDRVREAVEKEDKGDLKPRPPVVVI